nr:hypothetical protein [uncultured Janthinobacterium sp.]
MDFAPFGGAPFAGTHEQHGRQLEGRHRRDVAVVAVHGARQQRDIARFLMYAKGRGWTTKNPRS